MRFVNPIIFVRDIGTSTRFYRDTIGLAVVADHGDFVLFDGYFGVHDAESINRTVWNKAPQTPGSFGRDNLLLYFEDDDVEGCFTRLKDRVELIHPLQRQAWGQRVFRLYDPDRHAIEIGEPLK